MGTILQFEARDILEKVSMSVAIGLMKQAFLQLSAGKATVPLRTVIETRDQHGQALFMPSYSPIWQLYGVKMVSVFPDNGADLPVVQGSLLIMSGETGKPLALLDAGSVTALRTGAASGLATDLLAPKDASTLALFGTGTQSWTQAEGVIAVRKIQKIMVRGTSREKETDFCRRLSEKFALSCIPLNNPLHLKTADIICTATTAHQPLFTLDMIHPGAHINAIGAFKPQMRELGADVIRACRLFVDQREAVLAEAGDIVIPISEGLVTSDCIQAELGEIISMKKSGRTSSREVTVFKSVGNAIQDLAIANFLVGSLR